MVLNEFGTVIAIVNRDMESSKDFQTHRSAMPQKTISSALSM